MRISRLSWRALTYALLAGAVWAQATTAARPNIFFILVDDYGVQDVGLEGSKFYETPHKRLEKFHAEVLHPDWQSNPTWWKSLTTTKN